VNATGAISGVTTLTLQNIGGSATLSGDVDVTTLTVGATNANVAFTGNGSSVTNAVTFANTGTLTLGDAAGDTITFTGGLTTAAPSGISVAGTIVTTNTALNLGDADTAVTLTAASTFNAGTNTVTLFDTTGGANALTLIGDEIDLSGGANSITGSSTITLRPSTNATSIGIGGGAGTLDLNATDIAAVADGHSAINIGISGTGTHTIIANATSFKDAVAIFAPAGGTIAITGQLDTLLSTTNNTAATITLDGVGATTTLSANMVTAGAIIDIQDDVVIAEGFNILLDTTNAGGVAAGAAIDIEGSLDGTAAGGNETLQLNAGTGGAVTINSAGGAKATGGVDSLNLTIVNSASTTITGAAKLLTATLTDTTGAIQFLGNSDIGTALTTAAQAYSVSFTGTTNTVAGDTTFANTGGATLGNATGDSITFAGGLDTTAGTTNTAGSVITTDTQMDLGTVTLDADTVLDTGVAAASIMNVGAITSGANNLTLDSGANAAADITVASFAGGGDITVRDSGGTTFSGAVTADTVTLTDTTGAVVFAGNTAIGTGLTTAAQAYSVSFTGTTNTVAGATTFSNSGTVTLGDAAGDDTTFTAGVTATAPTRERFRQIRRRAQ